MITKTGTVTVKEAGGDDGIVISGFSFDGGNFASESVLAMEWAITRLQDEIQKMKDRSDAHGLAWAAPSIISRLKGYIPFEE